MSLSKWLIASCSSLIAGSFFFAASVFATEGLQVQVPTDELLCVRTFNAFGPAYAFHRNARATLASQFILNQECEVVAFQEVWLKDHAQVFRERFETSDYLWMEASKKETRVGLAIASRLPVVQKRHGVFEVNYSGWMDRLRKISGIGKGYLLSTLRWRNQNVHVVNVHLHHARTWIRLCQLIQLSLVLEELSGPVMVVGDMNFELSSLEADFLRSMGLHSLGSRDCTYCSRNPMTFVSRDRHIDHIFYSPEWRVVSRRVDMRAFQKVPLSDHYSFKAVLMLSPSGKKVVSSSQETKVRVARSLQKNAPLDELPPLIRNFVGRFAPSDL